MDRIGGKNEILYCADNSGWCLNIELALRMLDSQGAQLSHGVKFDIPSAHFFLFLSFYEHGSNVRVCLYFHRLLLYIPHLLLDLLARISYLFGRGMNLHTHQLSFSGRANLNKKALTLSLKKMLK